MIARRVIDLIALLNLAEMAIVFRTMTVFFTTPEMENFTGFLLDGGSIENCFFTSYHKTGFRGFPGGEIIGEIATKIISFSGWLKIFGEIFRHEKVEMIPTFSSRNILPHFVCKIKTNESAHAQYISPANSPIISSRGNPALIEGMKINKHYI